MEQRGRNEERCTEGSQDLWVATWNCNGINDYDAVMALAWTNKIDVLCLQEVKLTGNQRSSLARVALNYGYKYMATSETVWGKGDQLQGGVMTLSKTK